MFKGEPPKQIKDFLAEVGIKTSFWGFKKRLRYLETHILPGDDLFILGTAQDNPLVEEGKGEKNSDDIMIGMKKGNYFYVSDRDENTAVSKLNLITILGFIGSIILMIIGIFLAILFFSLVSF